MMKHSIAIISLLLLSTINATAAEPIKLKNGKVVYAYSASQTPDPFLKDECDMYVFADKKFTALKNGRYTAKDKSRIMVQDSCMLRSTGEAKLIGGDVIEFFIVDKFNTSGNAAFIKTKNGYERVNENALDLKNGQRIMVINNYVNDYGSFNGHYMTYDTRY